MSMDLSPNADELEDETTPMVESPLSMLPDLTTFGIEEFERGVCEDNYENRQILRDAKFRWQPVYNSNGEPTPYIQAISEDMIIARFNAVEGKKALLKDHRDIDSDYITGYSLLLSNEAEAIAPNWVLAATRKWNDVAEVRENATDAKQRVFRPALAGPPGRCSAQRTDGHRCQNWHGGRATEGGLCRMHVGNVASRERNTVNKARNRLNEAAAYAADIMVEMMNTATGENVRLNATKEVLDRVGIRGGTDLVVEHTLEVKPAAEILMERMEQLRTGMKSVENQGRTEEPEEEYAEVVEDESNANPNA